MGAAVTLGFMIVTWGLCSLALARHKAYQQISDEEKMQGDRRLETMTQGRKKFVPPTMQEIHAETESKGGILERFGRAYHPDDPASPTSKVRGSATSPEAGNAKPVAVQM